MKQLGILASLAGMAVVGQIAIAATPKDDHVVVADKLRAAFYVRAPRRVAKEMRVAVVEACRLRTGDADGEVSASLCKAADLYFFRAVRVNGFEDHDGFICEVDVAGDFIKYLPPDFIERNSTCAMATYDSESHAYSIVMYTE